MSICAKTAKMTIGVPVVTCLPRLYQQCTNRQKQSKDSQNRNVLKLHVSLSKCHVRPTTTLCVGLSTMMILQFSCLLLRILLLKFSGVTHLWSLHFADTWRMMVNIEINYNLDYVNYCFLMQCCSMLLSIVIYSCDVS